MGEIAGVPAAWSPRNRPTLLTQTTPPVAMQARICSSVMLRPSAQRACGLAWLKITGAVDAAMMSRLVRCPVCEQSIRMPAVVDRRHHGPAMGVSGTSSS
ncbi:MAG: hypothetical protein R3D25_21125 [Geminicoccaceae bacterium]